MNDSKEGKRLLEMQSKIDQDKLDLERLKGQLDQEMKILKDTFGCNSIRESSAKIKKWSEQYNKNLAILEEGLNNLEQDYDWGQ